MTNPKNGAMMDHRRPLQGRTLYPHDLRGEGLSTDALRAMIAAGAMPLMAGGQVSPLEPGMVGQPDPFGVFVDGDGRVVVDDFTNPISNIPELVRAFARSNEGYWIEDVFTAPGWTVMGGAVSYSVTHPGDHFLPAGKSLAPRAPGAEAPRIGGTRRRPIVAYPESVSGSLEVTDEARQRNNVLEVQTTFRQAANTFTETFQHLGELALEGLVQAADRIVQGGPGTFTDWNNAPRLSNTDSVAPRPSQEFARVRRLFQRERGGVLPDTLVWTPEDEEAFYNVYEEAGQRVLSQYGITRTLSTVRREPGNRLYLRSGQVGTMAWEKPVGEPEYTREGRRFTDVYTMEGRVVFVANGADAVLEVQDEVVTP